jgi:transcriptional regulator GlxA family with amidase domain
MAHVVGVAVTDQMAIFELGVVCEVFGIDRSDIVSPWYDFLLCKVSEGPLRTAAGLLVDTPYGINELLDADTILVPAAARASLIDPSPALLDTLREAHRRGKRIASICGGAYILAAAGLLDGKRATTHWMNAADFAARFPAVRLDPDVLYVDEGDVLTSAGTGAAIDLCLHLVRSDHGSAVANEIARRMVVPPHREGGQAQFAQPVPRVARPDPGLAVVLDWARQRLDRPLTVADLAAEARMSARTFARRFAETTGVSPLRWLVLQRVRVAQELLETTDEPVESIARNVGFGTAANLRLHFSRVTSVSPQTYRHVFRRRLAHSGESTVVHTG